MRFKRDIRHDYGVTDRKRLAAARKQRQEREALPLFAEQIAAEQPSIDAVMAGRVDRWEAAQDAKRKRLADSWRAARRRLAALPEPTRSRALAYWNGHRWLPGTADYLSDMVWSIETGRLVYDGETFRFAVRPREAAEAEHVPSYKPPMFPGLARTKAA